MKKLSVFLFCLILLIKVSGQVNFQTGSATHSIPVFSWEDNKSRLSSSIGLEYNSGNGLKVNDVASNVGQGWNLLAGGVITRMQIGEPDDQKPYFTGSAETWDDTKKYPAGYLYSSFNIRNGVSSTVNQYPLFKGKNIVYKQFNDVAADKELDRFAFNFNGRSGVFILDKVSNVGRLLEDSRIKIWFVKNENNASANQIRTTIVAFYIQDEKGSIYKFSKYSKTKILKTNYCNAEVTHQLTQPNFKNNKTYYEGSFEDPGLVHPYIINEWYLEEVEDALTHRKITFSYVTRNIDAKAGIAITHYNNVGDRNYSVVSHSKSKTETPELSTITWPDGYQLTLNYGKEREDMKGSYALASIDIRYAGRFSSKHELTTSYFIRNRVGSPKNAYQKSNARLCLLSVKKILPDLKGDEPPYVFSYYMGSSADDVIPAPFSHLKDIWGFYNGSNSKDFNNSAFPINNDISILNNNQLKGLCFLRNGSNDPVINPKNGYAKNGLLKQIIYPAGGSIKFEYEQNTAVMVGQSVQGVVGGVHVSKTSVTDGGFSNDCNNALVTNYKYTLDDAYTQSSLWGVEVPKNSMTVENYYSPADKYFYYKPIFDMGCKYRYQNPGILSRDQAVDLTGRQKFMQALSSVMNVVSAVSQVFDIVSVCMSATPAAILAIVVDVIGTLVNIVLTCFTDPSDTSTTHMYYNSDVNGSNALPSQFSRVEIKEGNGANGRTVMEFTSSADYAIWASANPAFTMKQRFAPYAYGLTKKETVYNSSNQKVKEIENGYDFLNAQIPYTPTYHLPQPEPDLPSCKFLVKKSRSKRSDDWTNLLNHQYPLAYISTSNIDVLVEVYDHFYGKVDLIQTVEKTFKTGTNDYVARTQNFLYGSFATGLISQITTTNSDGSYSTKKFKYSGDYTDLSFYNGPGVPSTNISVGILNTLRNNNVINELVSTTEMTGFGSGMLNEVVTEFTQISTGDVRPLRIIEQRFKSPFAGGRQYETPDYAALFAYQGTSAPYTAPNYNYKITQEYYYDNAGNLKGMKDEGGRTVRYIYDYDDRYIAATITNVDPATDICAYSSFETGSFGGFTFTGAINYLSSARTTGKRGIIVATNRVLSSTLDGAKRYRFSFYGFGSFVVSNATLVQSSFVNGNANTYYQYITNPGATSISLMGYDAGTGNKVDEVRLCPVDARMKTVAMDPLVGKLSDADENSRVTNYVYDKNGRLQFIKDEQNVIRKMYEYNFSKKPACPITYTNLEVVEYFTKNNCDAGTIGSDVPYTIPAGTYTSTHSQEAVDAMVDNDLETNGQAYANANGTCIPVFYNDAKSGSFFKDDCPVGYIGSTVSYNVPANRYRSLIDKADANQMAQDEIDANGQAWANTPGVSTCIINTTAQWEGTGCTQCVNNQNKVEVIDINPNSATYGQTQWIQTTDPCQAVPSPFYARLERENFFSYYDIYGSVESADYIVRFYENSACTIPYTITSSTIIKYNWSLSNSNSGNDYEERFKIPDIGTTQVSIGWLRTYWYSSGLNPGGGWYGLEEYETASYNLMTGCHYTIVN